MNFSSDGTFHVETKDTVTLQVVIVKTATVTYSAVRCKRAVGGTRLTFWILNIDIKYSRKNT